MTIDERFHNLFIFEMANNHQGSVEHGRRIIDAMSDIACSRGIRAGVKFQFRDLDTFIHPAFQHKADAKHIPRFLSTRLSREEFGELISYTRERGLLAIATPFDEASVAQCVEQDLAIIKVASCSISDWPLLEAVAAAGKPVVLSTGGASLQDIDKVVSFFSHKELSFALMHCVGVYPTPDALLHLSVIARLIRRYPGVPIGYSGHEAPDDVMPVITAISKGATLLERHVGVEASGVTLNAYSMNPVQTDAWVQAALRANTIAGDPEKVISEAEESSLRSLMRGTYARCGIAEGDVIGHDDVYFAMPLQEGQLSSGAYGAYRATYRASRAYKPDDPIREERDADPVLVMRDVIHQAKGMLNEAGIPVGKDCTVELSHHYGMERFREVGATIINMVNREYCKKLIIVLPGQRHPRHRHERKEETFEMLAGTLEVHLEDKQIVEALVYSHNKEGCRCR